MHVKYPCQNPSVSEQSGISFHSPLYSRMTDHAYRRLCAGILILIAVALLLCPAVAGLAQYRIHTNIDSAQVYFDNVYQGQTSGGVLTVSVPISRYTTVEIRKVGYTSVSQNLPYVPDGSSTDIYFTLNADSGTATATLAVKTNPSGASVYVNGIYQGTGPVTVAHLRPGTYTVIAEMPGTQSATQTVTLTTNEHRIITLNLGGSGTITFTSEPSGAYVSLNGVIIGTTPYTKSDIKPGEHQIVITKNGYYNWRETIDMSGGGARHIYAVLNSVTPENTIQIQSVPSGAAIYLNGIYQGETMKNGYFPINNIKTGQHTILLKINGYKDYQKIISLSEGQTITVSADMEVGSGSATPTPSAETGKLALSTSPPGAQIFIDGSLSGRMTPATISAIPIGTHTIRLELAGYAPAEATVTITAGQTTSLSLPLAPGGGPTPLPTKIPAPLFIPIAGVMALLFIYSHRHQ